MHQVLKLLLYFYHFFLLIRFFSPLGNVYISDQFNNRIRKVTGSTGIITTVVGTGTQSYSGDNGQATAATLFFPVGVSLDASGTCLYSH